MIIESLPVDFTLERKTEEVDGVMTAFDSLTYNENEIRRIAKRGFDIAMKRRRKLQV